MKHNILFFPWRDFNRMEKEGFRTREAKILKQLTHSPNVDKILCINRSTIPTYLNPLLRTFNLQIEFGDSDKAHQVTKKVIYKDLFSELIEVDSKLYVLNIKYHIPNPKGNKLEDYSMFKSILNSRIKKALKKLDFKSFITWNFDLSRVDTSINHKGDLLIFDAIDNLLEHDQKQNEKEKLRKKYNLVRENSRIIFTVSEALRKDIFNDCENSFFIPNGIDLDMYCDLSSDRPDDLPNKPTIGYVGLLQERVDVDLLFKAVTNFTTCNFVFIGPLLSPNHYSKLQSLPNVIFLGSKHHDLIPNYINHFDICLIPHKVNKFTKSMNPLKLYEYLAAGKEVITTPVPPSEKFLEVIHVVENEDEFCNTISQILSSPYQRFSKEMILENIKEHDWNKRVEYMLEIVDKTILGQRGELNGISNGNYSDLRKPMEILK